MPKSVHRSARGVIVGLCLCLAFTASALAASDVKILVIDQQSVLQTSLAGQDIGRQAAALRDQIQKELQAEQKAIVGAQKDLQSNANVYSPAQREQKIKALEARQRAYPMFEQRRNQVLQISVQQASNQLATTLRPILQKIIDERKATLLLDRAQVMYAAPSYDITQDAIKRLNDTIKTVKVVRADLDKAPATAAAQRVPAQAPKPSGASH